MRGERDSCWTTKLTAAFGIRRNDTRMRGKNRWALTALGRIRCLKSSVIDVWSGLKLPLSDDPRLTFSNSSAQKRAGLEMLFHPDGSAELRTGVLNQLSLYFLSLFLLESHSYQTVTGSSSYSGTLRKHSIISGTTVFHVFQDYTGMRDKLMTILVSTCESCCLCLSGCQWCLHASALTGDIWPAWG